MLKNTFKYLIAGVLAVLIPGVANAKETLSLEDVAQVDVLPGWQMDNGRHMAAIRIRLAPGWKTYWRAPGDSGIPPRFGWEGSKNLNSVTFHWPTPTVFYLNGLRSIGYKGDVVIPIELSSKNPGKDNIILRGEIEFGVCKDICIPVLAQIGAKLNTNKQPDPMITASLNNRPSTAKKAGVGGVTCVIEPISDGLRLTARIDIRSLGPKEVTVVELSDQTIWISQSESNRDGRYLTAVADLVPSNGQPFLLNRSDIRFTVLGDKGAVDIRGCTAG